VREWLTERRFRPLDDRPCGRVAPRRPHSGFLGPLTGEDDRDAHFVNPLRLGLKCSDPGARGPVTSIARSRASVADYPQVTSITRR
jgi:hypothetical protein